MFKVTFFLISLVTGQEEMILNGSGSYENIISCNSAATFVAENSPVGYATTWECEKR